MSGRPASQPVRIAYIAPISLFFGSERSLFETLRVMDRQRYVPLLVTVEPGPLEHAARAQGIAVERVAWLRNARRSWCGMRVGNSYRLSQWLRERHIAILQLNLYAPFLGLDLGTCVVAARLAGTKFILRHRVVGSWWLSLAEKFWLSQCDRIVSVSRGAVEPWLRPRRSDRLARIRLEQLTIVPSSRDMSRLAHVVPDASFRSRWGIPADAKLVGMVARIDPLKRQDLLLRVAGLIAQRDRNVWFVIVGGSEWAPGYGRPYEESLRVMAHKLGIADRTVFTGHVDDPLPIMRQFDVAVLPSRQEALGGVLIEAMGLGIPVVASHQDGIVETVQDGQTGILVDGDNPSRYADVIARLLRDPALARRMGTCGREWATRFDTSRVAPVLEQCYDELVGTQR